MASFTMPDPAQEALYQSLRVSLQDFEPQLTAEEIDDWIVDALTGFKICNTDIYVKPGQTHTEAVMLRTSTETKIRALQALLA